MQPGTTRTEPRIITPNPKCGQLKQIVTDRETTIIVCMLQRQFHINRTKNKAFCGRQGDRWTKDSVLNYLITVNQIPKNMSFNSINLFRLLNF